MGGTDFNTTVAVKPETSRAERPVITESRVCIGIVKVLTANIVVCRFWMKTRQWSFLQLFTKNPIVSNIIVCFKTIMTVSATASYKLHPQIKDAGHIYHSDMHNTLLV